MLQVHQISKRYGPDSVLDHVSFSLGSGERLGLVGPNGSGKSTLLRLLAGELEPDSGTVWVDPASRVAYLPQYPLDDLSLTVEQALVRASGRVGGLRSRMAELETAMAAASGQALDQLMARYADARDEFERLDGYLLPARMDEVLRGLDMAAAVHQPVSSLSGGNKTRLSLARLLLSGADIVLLDEPTTFLDLPALLWLEHFVMSGERSYIVVSHDRRFLDSTVTGILEIDPEKHSVRQWPGAFSAYAEARRLERLKQLESYRDQQERIERIEADIRRTRDQARTVERTTLSGMGADSQRRRAKKVAKKAASRERKLERDLADETIEKPKQEWGLHLADLGRDPVEGRRLVLEARGMRAGYGGQEVVRGVDLVIRGGDRMALLGANGSGKSTLLRCFTGSLSFSGDVRLGASIRPGILSQEGEQLPLDRSVLEAFRARIEMHERDARTYLHRFLFTGAQALKPVRELSYGQRAKLALAILVLSDANFLILDEPTSHLDMPAMEAVEEALSAFQGPLVVVSHDRYFLNRIGINRIVVMDEGQIRDVGSMEEYEVWAVAGVRSPA